MAAPGLSRWVDERRPEFGEAGTLSVRRRKRGDGEHATSFGSLGSSRRKFGLISGEITWRGAVLGGKNKWRVFLFLVKEMVGFSLTYDL